MLFDALLGAAMLLSALNISAAASHGGALWTDEQTINGVDPCRLDLRLAGQVTWRGTYGRGYEASSADNLEQVNVAVLHEGEACRWFVTADRPVDGAFLTSAGGGRLAFDVLQSPSGPSILSDDVEGTTFSRLEGAFASTDGSQALPLFVSIPPGQVVRAGTYSSQIIMRLYRVGNGSPQLVAQAPLPVLAAVPPILSVSSRDFAPGALGGSLDLGNLEQGGSKTVGFDVVANSDISITFASAGAGLLRHQFGSLGIPYRVIAGGRSVNLAGVGSVERFTASPGTPLALDLVIVVDPPRQAAAGTYRDELVVTFRADE